MNVVATGVARYVDRCTNGPLSIEVAFDGGAESSGNENPRKTNVVVRLLRRANEHWESSPWIERWAQSYGDPVMPSGAWNGVKLCELIGDRAFVAVGAELSEVNAENGKALWTVTTGNTPIYWIMKSRDESGLIVFNGYYNFDRDDQLSNIGSVTLDGIEEWRSPLPSSDDIFANRPVFDGKDLKSSSWNGFTCKIDQSTGEITDREFTK
jgi:outer membrane protein assembly factor BamB